MASLPSAKINELYTQFKSDAVTFTKEVIAVTGLLPGMVSLKCASMFFPCVIYSSSFEMAKVVANNKSGIIEKQKQPGSALSIRFTFCLRETGEQVVFLVPVRFSSMAPYSGSQEMSILNLQFSQRPPDDLIEILGHVHEANYYSSTQSEKLFPMTPEAFRKMRFLNKEVVFSIGETNLGSLPRELGFKQGRFILKDTPKSILEKPFLIKFNFDNPHETNVLECTVLKHEFAVDHPEISIVTLAFKEPVLLAFKLRLAEYVSSLRIAPSKETPGLKPQTEVKTSAEQTEIEPEKESVETEKPKDEDSGTKIAQS
ncbi:MAG: hypothetical protein LBG79_09150 [Spirochaetaceae bacterium]|jgi:hypothetical protein|nr:hypothetical protein [Spirochaetaceae bacterium]GMO26411.1 MAG: PilZ domain-containing protein [Termitinemataceae bacterium]